MFNGDKKMKVRKKKCPECGKQQISANFVTVIQIKEIVKNGFVVDEKEVKKEICDTCYWSMKSYK